MEVMKFARVGLAGTTPFPAPPSAGKNPGFSTGTAASVKGSTRASGWTPTPAPATVEAAREAARNRDLYVPTDRYGTDRNTWSSDQELYTRSFDLWSTASSQVQQTRDYFDPVPNRGWYQQYTHYQRYRSNHPDRIGLSGLSRDDTLKRAEAIAVVGRKLETALADYSALRSDTNRSRLSQARAAMETFFSPSRLP